MPLERVRGGGWRGADAAPTGHALRVDGAEVSALLRDDAGALVVRVVNLSPERRRSRRSRRADGPLAGEVVDLTGATVAAFDGSVPLRPWELVTLRVADR